MIVIADVSIPADAFPLGRILEEYPEMEIELERIVPLHDAVIPLFWVSDGDTEAIEATLKEDPLTKSVRPLTQTDSRVLYEVEWSPEVNGVVQSLFDSDARLLEAEGTVDVWDFRLQFRTRSDLDRFREACEENGIPVTLRRLYNPALPEENGQLSARQYEALVSAYKGGYFEVPRGTSMSTLAAEFEISDSAVSQRLRRGTAALIAETLLPEYSQS
ncbi:Predicted DNA binding protein, contains HTH domain [Haladaptatus litoreus]|uniref:Predicted DNA binding protein, contains HTH domain n=1 Tax=Haladaptatus litoreus TaxID=553468 RepID=A0A1N7FAE3_9EURY|nr:bacterio-opsin activator domain-containing protein [Haladaptatus litoreus]SIR97293.1 Predicted DNA binding protein, contains HTH domain [Haladaptatus litoreus]